MDVQELLNRIRREEGSFPAAQRLVAAYIVENYNQIPFLTISTLAKNIGVSDNTIVKFCNHLGYDKFTEFKKLFCDYAHSELVMFNKFSESEPDTADRDNYFAIEIEESSANIRATLSDPINQQNLPKLLAMIDKAERIYITGGRISSVLSAFFANVLRYLNLKVYEVNGGAGDYLDRLSMIEKNDLVIVFSFPRYTTQVVDAVRDLQGAGVPVVLITDTGLSPAQAYSDLAFHCSMTSSYYFPSYSGCLALISTICRAAGTARKVDAAHHIRQLESRLLERGIFL